MTFHKHLLKLKLHSLTSQGKLVDVVENGSKSVISEPSPFISHLLFFLLALPPFITDATTITDAFTLKSLAVSALVTASL